jgi:hypothetical protein
MRRCPRCREPNPAAAPFCAACGADLPRVSRGGVGWEDLWDGPALKRVAAGLLPALLFSLSFGGLLTVGSLRVEGRFALFHLVHGLLLGAALAWAWKEAFPRGWAPWLAAGLAGGLLAEALDAWYSYHGLMGFFSLALWQWLGMREDRALVYEILQTLRMGAPALALWVLYCARTRENATRRALALLWLALGLGLRSRVRGAWVDWRALGCALGIGQTALYAASLLALGWGLAPRGLTRKPEIR